MATPHNDVELYACPADGSISTIRHMKKSSFVLAALCVSFSFSVASALAAPFSPSNEGRDYVNGARSLSNWGVGANLDFAKKDLDFDKIGTREVETSKAMAYVGYSALRWVMPYVTFGQSQTKLKDGPEVDNNGNFCYGVGAAFNLFDHDIANSFLLEDRLRVNGSLEYTRSSMDLGIDSIDFGAFDASLTAGIVNDLQGATAFIPDSITLFGGPIYSRWMGSDFEAGDDVGFTVGLEVFYTVSVSFNVRANFMKDHPGGSAGINVHF